MWVRVRSTRVTCAVLPRPKLSPSLVASSSPAAPPPTMTKWCSKGSAITIRVGGLLADVLVDEASSEVGPTTAVMASPPMGPRAERLGGAMLARRRRPWPRACSDDQRVTRDKLQSFFAPQDAVEVTHGEAAVLPCERFGSCSVPLFDRVHNAAMLILRDHQDGR